MLPIPFNNQTPDQADCGPACLRMVLHCHQKHGPTIEHIPITDPPTIEQIPTQKEPTIQDICRVCGTYLRPPKPPWWKHWPFRKLPEEGTSLQGMIHGGEHYGFQVHLWMLGSSLPLWRKELFVWRKLSLKKPHHVEGWRDEEHAWDTLCHIVMEDNRPVIVFFHKISRKHAAVVVNMTSTHIYYLDPDEIFDDQREYTKQFFLNQWREANYIALILIPKTTP